MEHTNSTNQNGADKVATLRPLQDATRVEILKARYEAIRALGKRASAIVDEVTDDYIGSLDRFVAKVEELLDEIQDGKRKEFSDKDLYRFVMRLPILMYRGQDVLDRAAIEASVAKAANKHVYSQYYIDSEGTIPEREAFATLKAAEEAVIVDLSRHVYNRVKGKLDKAGDLFDAVRKVITSKDTDKSVFGRSNA